MKTRLNALIVLDRSGSMQGSEGVTVSAVNEYLGSLSRNPECDAYVTLVTFDSESIDTVFSSAPAGGVGFTEDQFVPRAMTPLLDAVGHGIGLLDEAIADGELGALVVLTDGQENCSKKFSQAQIRKLLQDRQEQAGWLVLFLGADIEAWDGAAEVGVHADRALSYSKDKSSEMSEVLGEATARYVSARDPKEVVFDEATRKRVR